MEFVIYTVSKNSFKTWKSSSIRFMRYALLVHKSQRIDWSCTQAKCNLEKLWACRHFRSLDWAIWNRSMKQHTPDPLQAHIFQRQRKYRVCKVDPFNYKQMKQIFRNLVSAVDHQWSLYRKWIFEGWAHWCCTVQGEGWMMMHWNTEICTLSIQESLFGKLTIHWTT